LIKLYSHLSFLQFYNLKTQSDYQNIVIIILKCNLVSTQND
jgi:hypothetical protein